MGTITTSESEEKFKERESNLCYSSLLYRKLFTYIDGHGNEKKSTKNKLIIKNTVTGRIIANGSLCATMTTQQLTNQIIPTV